jgi:hypothetical protein
MDIAGVSEADAGVYACRVYNARGEASTECQLSVVTRPGILYERQIPLHSTMDLKEYLKQYTSSEIVITEADMFVDGTSGAPEFKVALEDIEVLEGSFARFETQVTPVNDPYIKVEWLLNGEPIMLGE